MKRSPRERQGLVSVAFALGVSLLVLSAGPAQAATGRVGLHTAGRMQCDASWDTIEYFAPNIYAFNARSGVGNDNQHVAWTMYIYKWNGATWAYTGLHTGPWTSWGSNGYPAVDNRSASTGAYATGPMNLGPGSYLLMVYETWYDFPSTYASTATHYSVTGSDYLPAGQCTL